MGSLRNAVNILGRAQCVPGANVQMLNEWTAKYNDHMMLLNGVHEELCNSIDNVHPMTKGKPHDDDAEASADVPSVG
jgi:hypothetical protein